LKDLASGAGVSSGATGSAGCSVFGAAQAVNEKTITAARIKYNTLFIFSPPYLIHY
jgi:hypothetical protein